MGFTLTPKKLESRLYYITENDGKKSNKDNINKQDISGVQLVFCCPWCDKKNSITHSYPLSSTISYSCDNCNRKFTHDAENLEDIENQIQYFREERRYRVAGQEDYPINGLKQNFLNQGTVLALGTLFSILYLLSVLVTVFTEFLLLGLVAQIAFGVPMLASIFLPYLLESKSLPENPTYITKNRAMNFYRHGIKVEKGGPYSGDRRLCENYEDGEVEVEKSYA